MVTCNSHEEAGEEGASSGEQTTTDKDEELKGEVKAKIKISPVVVFGVLSRMVVVRGS